MMTFCTDTSAFKSASITEWMDIGEGADSTTPERGEAPRSEVTRGGRCIDRRRKEAQDAGCAFGCVMSFPTGKTELAGKCFSGSKTLPALKIKL